MQKLNFRMDQLTLSLRCNHWKIQNRGDFPDAINSIRRSANGRSEANDVSLLWRHTSWSRSWRLERAYRPFLTVLENLNPQNVVGHRVDPKKGTSLRHNACFELLGVRIHPRMTSVGESGKKIKKALYFTYFARRSLTADWHKFWVTCSSRGHNQLCKVLS